MGRDRQRRNGVPVNIWYTSDLHLMHDRVAQHRGFDSTAEHDQVVTDNWQATVRPDDEVFVLGDLTLKNPNRIVDTITSLPGRKHLIAGNHDACHPINRRWRNKLPVYEAMFSTITVYDHHRIAGHEVLLSHFPYGSRVSRISPGPEWRPTTYEGYYANVKGQIRGKFGRVLKTWMAGSGYEYVTVSLGSAGTRSIGVHVLVCEAFHGPCPTGMETAHNDGNKLNNHATNLRWTTHRGNAADKCLHGTSRKGVPVSVGEDNPMAKLSASDVSFIRESDLEAKQLADEFGVAPTTIYSVKRMDTWTEPPPTTADHTTEIRHPEYRLPDVGHWLLHGHTHSPKILAAGPWQIHIGLDAWNLHPVNAETIANIITADTP